MCGAALLVVLSPETMGLVLLNHRIHVLDLREEDKVGEYWRGEESGEAMER